MHSTLPLQEIKKKLTSLHHISRWIALGLPPWEWTSDVSHASGRARICTCYAQAVNFSGICDWCGGANATDVLLLSYAGFAGDASMAATRYQISDTTLFVSQYRTNPDGN